MFLSFIKRKPPPFSVAIFPSDKNTLDFLRAQDREDDWQELLSDEGAEYIKTCVLNLNEIEPMIACPHNPGNVKRVKEVAGIKLHQVAIGSCTNSSFTDLMQVAMILKGRRVHPDVNLVIAPGSRQVLTMLAESGALTHMINAGARIMEPACGFCIGAGQSPPDGGDLSLIHI